VISNVSPMMPCSDALLIAAGALPALILVLAFGSPFRGVSKQVSSPALRVAWAMLRWGIVLPILGVLFIALFVVPPTAIETLYSCRAAHGSHVLGFAVGALVGFMFWGWRIFVRARRNRPNRALNPGRATSGFHPPAARRLAASLAHTRIGWFFRTNASRREKVFTLFGMGWCALSFYGMTSGFVAEAHVIVIAGYTAVPIALAFFIPLFRDRHPSNKIPSFGLLKRSFVYLILLALVYGIAWVGVALGVTSLGTVFFGEEFVGEFRVVSKSDGTSKPRGCDHSLRLEDVRSHRKREVCVSEEFWALVRQGELVQAQGKRSSFGSMLEKVWTVEGRSPS
jgi:hypothetical protein